MSTDKTQLSLWQFFKVLVHISILGWVRRYYELEVDGVISPLDQKINYYNSLIDEDFLDAAAKHLDAAGSADPF